jgi:uncharacterized protein (DUF58 family)
MAFPDPVPPPPRPSSVPQPPPLPRAPGFVPARPASSVAPASGAATPRPPPLPGQRPPTRLAPPQLARPRPSLLTLDELERFKNLLLFAQSQVDGLYAGRHRSSLPGSSAEFRDFKNYAAGDPIDHVDWRAYGRTRRLFVRRYEDETDLTAYLLVDTSASMAYAGQGRLAKFRHAARLAAALAYLMLRQGDKAALGLFAEKLVHYTPPGGTRQHLHDLVTLLENVRPEHGTGLTTALEQAASVCRRRGRLIVLSDLHVDHAALFDALARFAHRGFRILLLQVLDPDELELPARHVARYQDMESGAALEVDSDDIGPAYRERVRAMLDALAREASGRGIEHQIVNTARPYTAALEAYLGFRQGPR